MDGYPILGRLARLVVVVARRCSRCVRVCVCVLKAREKQHGRGVQQPVELALRTKRAEDLYFRVRGKDRSKSRDRRTNECGLD